MAVPNVPFWLSQANTEFQANGWGSNILSKAGLGTTGLLGQLAGRSAVSVIGTPPGTVHTVKKAPYFSIYNGAANTVFQHNNGGTVQTINLTSGVATHVRFTLQTGGNATPTFNNCSDGVQIAIPGYSTFAWPEVRFSSWPQRNGYYDAYVKMEVWASSTLLGTWYFWLDVSSA